MNDAIKRYMIEKGWIGCDASDEEFDTVLGEKLDSGDFPVKEYTQLRKQANQASDDKASKFMSQIQEAVSKGIEAGIEKAKAIVAPEGDEEDDVLDGLTPQQKAAIVAKFGQKNVSAPTTEQIEGTIEKAHSGLEVDGDSRMRVKDAVEKWDDTKTGQYFKNHSYFRKGEPAVYNGKAVNRPTERTRGMAVVWMKMQAMPEYLTEHDRKVARYIVENEKFFVPGEQSARLLRPDEKHKVWKWHTEGLYAKAVIDDTTSGGQYAVPEFFDTDFIVTPILDEENIPSYCNIIDVPRGSSANSFVLGSLTLGWNNAEASAVSLFSTSGLISNHDTSFFNVKGFVQIGREWEEDAVPGMADALLMEYQKALTLELGKVITSGDGTSQPQGITNATGVADVTPATPTTGPIARADLIKLIFGVNKAYRNNGGRNTACFIMTDTSYRNARNIEVGSGDQRGVLTGDVVSYEIEGFRVLVEESGLSDSDGIFAQLRGYRLYRRQGGRTIVEDRGDTLVRSSTRLLGIEGRFGGQLDQGGYASYINAWPA